jgi:hypothetical protein
MKFPYVVADFERRLNHLLRSTLHFSHFGLMMMIYDDVRWMGLIRIALAFRFSFRSSYWLHSEVAYMEFGGGHVQNFAQYSGRHCTSTALEEHWPFAKPIYQGRSAVIQELGHRNCNNKCNSSMAVKSGL